MMDEIRSLEDLLDFQREDSRIDRLLERRGGMPELDDYKGAHARLAELDAQIQDVTGQLREMALGIDKADGELKLGEAKLEREEQRLFAGGLSAKEAEHLRQEVDMLRRQNSEAETTILELMDARETAQAELDGLQETRRGVAAEQERLAGIIQSEWKAIDDEIAIHEVKKTELAPLIDEELMEMYDQLRPIKQGVAVARMAEGVCGGCHLALSAAEQSQVLKSYPSRCLHCRRILVPQ
jgi:predicted  nucleic acid-binding Zn-ribbon protein